MTTDISLRDYFAAAALQGLLTGHMDTTNYHYYSAISYRHADAMLAEREKRERQKSEKETKS